MSKPAAFVPAIAAGLFLAVAVAAEPGSAPAQPLTAAEIVAKNVAARGGLEAWRKIDRMAWLGHIETPRSPGAPLPFSLEVERPNKARFEVSGTNQKALRLYDGAHGWKMRPAREGGVDLQPYTAEEANAARDAQVVDGPLIDCVAKGIAVTLEGTGEVDGRRAYRLGARAPSGAVRHLWLDATTFLEFREDRDSQDPLGHSRTVSIYYGDYRPINGLMIPSTMETRGAKGEAGDKMVIERVALNPAFPPNRFSKPRIGGKRGTVTIGGGDPGLPQH